MSCAELGLGVELPPEPQLPNPQVPPSPDDVLDLQAVFDAHLRPTSPDEAATHALVETLVSYDRLAKQLARRLVDLAVATGRPSDGYAAMQALEQLKQSRSLIREIQQAARAAEVPLSGLVNGARRVHRMLTNVRRSLLPLFAMGTHAQADGLPPTNGPGAPALVAWRDRRPPTHAVGEDPVSVVIRQLLNAIDALRQQESARAQKMGHTLRELGLQRQDGVLTATGVLLELESLVQRGPIQPAHDHRTRMGTQLQGLDARTGLSILARWSPSGHGYAGR